KERRNPASGPNPMLRPLPPRPGPPDERLKKLELGRGRTSGPRPRGPLRADHGVPLPGSPPPTVALPLPSRTNLARSKGLSWTPYPVQHTDRAPCFPWLLPHDIRPVL
ncbi:USP21 isoform 6, partial [Pan troglodytes]